MLLFGTLLAACGSGTDSDPIAPPPTATATATPIRDVVSVTATPIGTFAAPWSIAFLPDGRLLITERPVVNASVIDPSLPGSLHLVSTGGASTSITGLPDNVGMLDVALHPDYAVNGQIYFTFMERDPSAPRTGRGEDDARIAPAGLALGIGTLIVEASGVRLSNVRVLWRQAPKIVSLPGSGEPGGRLALSPDGAFLFLSAGDRQEFAPVQDLANSLGKIIRLNLDGSAPASNPFVGKAGALPEIWTLGHRNPYGLAFDATGRLWEHENGPTGGDELNPIERGSNYGWPNVSFGDPYPRPVAGDGFGLPATYWTPAIAPSGLIFYRGDQFAAWRGDAIISGLQSKSVIRVRVSGATAIELQRIPLGARIRAVKEAPDGAIWVLEDGPAGRLLKLAPVFG